MTSPTSTALGELKCDGLLSSKSSMKRSRYVYIGALPGLVRVGATSVTGAVRPSVHGTEGAPAVPAATTTAGEEVRDAA